MPGFGRFVVAALLCPGVSRNKALKLSSFVASQTDISTEFEKHTGGEWKADYTSLEELAVYETRAWKQDAPVDSTCSLRRLRVLTHAMRSAGKGSFCVDSSPP